MLFKSAQWPLHSVLCAGRYWKPAQGAIVDSSNCHCLKSSFATTQKRSLSSAADFLTFSFLADHKRRQPSHERAGFEPLLWSAVLSIRHPPTHTHKHLPVYYAGCVLGFYDIMGLQHKELIVQPALCETQGTIHHVRDHLEMSWFLRRPRFSTLSRLGIVGPLTTTLNIWDYWLLDLLHMLVTASLVVLCWKDSQSTCIN